MALKKSELYSSLWASCDELRGGMDASQYKDYGLVLLFIKYVSDKYAGVPFAPITIPDGASFHDMVALKGKPSIGDDIKVTVKAVAPNWEEYEPEPESAHMDALQGGYQWQISMPPGERSELSASYEIRLPSKFELRGGNRREW